MNHIQNDINTNINRIFPPGTIYAIYTDENSIFYGEHFLTSRVMDCFVRVLGQTELNPTPTNDLKGVKFFRILEKFIQGTILPNSNTLTKRQMNIFICQFQKYLKSKLFVGKNQHNKRDHLVRRVEFVKNTKKEKWIEKLQEKAEKLCFR